MKKITLILVLVFALFTNLSFALGSSPEKTLRVMLDRHPNPDHAPLIIAIQQGFFKEQGLNVQLINPTNNADPSKSVANGKADIGISYEPQYIQHVDQGLPLIRIGTLIDRPLDCVVALKDSGIKTFADLKGKRIAKDSSRLSSLMLNAMLTNAGLTEKDVQLVNIRGNLMQALLSHRIDAVSGTLSHNAIPQIEETGHNVVTFFPESHGVPTYSVLIFVVNTAAIHDKRYPKFLTAIKKAVRYLDEHPKEAWTQFAKQYPEANNEASHQAWFTTLPYFDEDPANYNSEEWQHFAQFMQQHHLIKKIQPTSRYSVILR